MNLVKEYINFERGGDPLDAMSIGKASDPHYKVKDYLRKEINKIIELNNIEKPKIKEREIGDAYNIQFNNGRNRYVIEYFYAKQFTYQFGFKHQLYYKGKYRCLLESGKHTEKDCIDKLKNRISLKSELGYLAPGAVYDIRLEKKWKEKLKK